MSAADSALIRAVLRLYPQPWRDRYEEEFAGLLGDLMVCSPRRGRLRLLANAASGAADAHLNLGGGRAMTERIRSSLGVMICALVVFAIAGAGFQKMTEYPDFTAAASRHASVGTSFSVLRDAAFAAGVIVAAAAVPLVWSILRQAIRRRRPRLLMWLALPPVAIGAWTGLVRLVLTWPGHPRFHAAATDAQLTIVVGCGAVVAVLCAWSALRALREADLPDRLLRAEVIPMVAVVACMAAITITDLSWGLAVRAADAPLFHSDNGLLATGVPATWLTGLIVLAAATVVAGRAASRAAGQLHTGPAR